MQPETPETRAKLAGAIRDLQSKGDNTSIDQLVRAYKAKYQPVQKQSVAENIADFTGGKQLAQGFGQALALKGNSKLLEQTQNQQFDLQKNLIQRINEDKAQGRDVTKLQEALKNLSEHIQETGTSADSLLNQDNLTGKEVIGSGIQLAANVIPGAPKSASLGQKVLVGASQGYAYDIGNKLQDKNKTIGESFIPGAGAIAGAAIPIAGAGLKKITDNLPTWLTRKALPKLDTKNVDFALKKPIGTINGLYADSQKAVNSFENQVQSTLSHPQYDGEVGKISEIVPGVKSAYQNANLDDKKIINIVKNVAKVNATLVDKVANGTASLLEQNTLRKELDHAVYPKFTDTPSLTFNKQIGKKFSDLLRQNVQNTAQETAPIFSEYAKEINFRNALATASKKIQKGAAVGLYDIMAGIGGGIPGVITEKTVRAPAVQLGAAKVINKAGEIGKNKVVNTIKKVLSKGAVIGASKLTK